LQLELNGRKRRKPRYILRTGPYPQIIHEPSWNATGGVITCEDFVDLKQAARVLDTGDTPELLS